MSQPRRPTRGVEIERMSALMVAVTRFRRDVAVVAIAVDVAAVKVILLLIVRNPLATLIFTPSAAAAACITEYAFRSAALERPSTVTRVMMNGTPSRCIPCPPKRRSE